MPPVTVNIWVQSYETNLISITYGALILSSLNFSSSRAYPERDESGVQYCRSKLAILGVIEARLHHPDYELQSSLATFPWIA
jgi:hypothetical protein